MLLAPTEAIMHEADENVMSARLDPESILCALMMELAIYGNWQLEVPYPRTL